MHCECFSQFVPIHQIPKRLLKSLGACFFRIKKKCQQCVNSIFNDFHYVIMSKYLSMTSLSHVATPDCFYRFIPYEETFWSKLCLHRKRQVELHQVLALVSNSQQENLTTFQKHGQVFFGPTEVLLFMSYLVHVHAVWSILE